MNNKIKITKSFVDKALPPTEKDQIFYRDSELKGFALRVTASGTKSFVVEKNIGNKVRRMTIGKFGALTAELARKEAQKIIGQIATGTDPIAEKRSHRVKLVTLDEVFNDYLRTRKSLKASTLVNYKQMVSRPAEPPREPLAERCGSLSTHTAPIRQTHQPYLFSSAQTN